MFTQMFSRNAHRSNHFTSNFAKGSWSAGWWLKNWCRRIIQHTVQSVYWRISLVCYFKKRSCQAASFMLFDASGLFSLWLRRILGLCQQGDDVGRTQRQHWTRNSVRYRRKMWTSHWKMGLTNLPPPTRPQWPYEQCRVSLINVLIVLQVSKQFLETSLMVLVLFILYLATTLQYIARNKFNMVIYFSKKLNLRITCSIHIHFYVASIINFLKNRQIQLLRNSIIHKLRNKRIHLLRNKRVFFEKVA